MAVFFVLVFLAAAFVARVEGRVAGPRNVSVPCGNMVFMLELRISPEIRALLGPEGLARAAEVFLTGGQCVICR